MLITLSLKCRCVQACINVGRYCLWAKTQVGPIPRIPFGVCDVRDPVPEEGHWGQMLVINYSIVLKTFYGMDKKDINRFLISVILSV